jgi:hypothetical protein
MSRYLFSKKSIAFHVNARALRSNLTQRRQHESSAKSHLRLRSAKTAAQDSKTQKQLDHLKQLFRLSCLLIAVCVLSSSYAEAQTRSLPSHGKIKIDSYNYLLRDVHPASQAQANYLQNRLFTSGLKKHERLERQERLDIYGERQTIELLGEYQDIARRLAAGQPVSHRSLPTFWTLVSAYGDRTEVYDALASYVPHIAHDEFVPTSRFLQILEADGELKLPPPLLAGIRELDASRYQVAWNTLVASLRSSGHLSAAEAASFHECVTAYRQQAKVAVPKASPAIGRVYAKKYVDSLQCLANALYHSQQSAQIQQYVHQRGYAYRGETLLGLIQHLVRNRVNPAHGSTAQIALAEVARPICIVLEHEAAIRSERIDSLAAGEGHRPYATEYRRSDGQTTTTPGVKVAQNR